MTDLGVALGLVLAIEGLLFASFPAGARRAGENLASTPETTLRLVGVLSAAVGVFIVWLLRG